MESKRIFRGKEDELQSRLVSDFIGNTPFVRLSEKVYAKLESVNPGGSIKDRPVKWILDDAENAMKRNVERITKEIEHAKQKQSKG